jgi:hypothetical protein
MAPYPQPGSETKRRTEVLSSDQNLPPDLKELIALLMRVLAKKNWNPKLLVTASDYERALNSSHETKLKANDFISKFRPNELNN